jgi:putative phage-type endonuclease
MFEQLQRTAAWHEARKGRITGSQAGALLGLSPWQTQAEAIRAWVRNANGAESEILDNPAFSWGRSHERAAQLALMRSEGITINDCGFLTHEDWLGASPDGLADDGRVIEIKCPFGWRNKSEPETKPLIEQPHYYAQVQIEMLCANAPGAVFAQYRPAFGDPFSDSYSPEFLHVEHVALDPSWRAHYLPELRDLWATLRQELDNPAHMEPLRVPLDSDEAARLVEYIGELDASIEQAEQARKQALADLVKLADGKNAVVYGRNLTLVKRAGAISYAKAIKALCPDADLEKWRGAASEYWKLG